MVCLYIRGQHRDYDIWRQLGNKGWSWNDVLPYFIKAENQERGKNEYHGVGWTSYQFQTKEYSLPLLDEFQKCCRRVWYSKNRRILTQVIIMVVATYQVTEKDGFRCSTAVGYLNPIKKRPNLKIITKCACKKNKF